jgi:hypothetical protein
MRSFLSILLLVALPASAAAQGSFLTVRDIVDLTKAGLGDEALIALIEVNRPVFPVDVDTLKRRAGMRHNPLIRCIGVGAASCVRMPGSRRRRQTSRRMRRCHSRRSASSRSFGRRVIAAGQPG